jgi:predicted transposase/invertase (TIGR01784 family)
MTHYLDPKNDLVFKRIFGEHPDLLISFLNALLPLAPGREIREIEYLPAEMVPFNPLLRNSIVDVRCRDLEGRQFIVEMQMHWTPDFSSRLLFNASKLFNGQLKKGEHYSSLQPVYCLAILNENFDRLTPSFYHHFMILNTDNIRESIPGMEFVLVELSKFRPEAWPDRRMAVLWLRFLREVKDDSSLRQEVSSDLLSDNTIQSALDICAEGAFSSGELAAYEKYWDIVSTEKTLYLGKHREGLEEGLAQGLAQGLEQGLAEGLAQGARETTVQIVKDSRRAGLSVGNIALITRLTPGEVEAILSGE